MRCLTDPQINVNAGVKAFYGGNGIFALAMWSDFCPSPPKASQIDQYLRLPSVGAGVRSLALRH